MSHDARTTHDPAQVAQQFAGLSGSEVRKLKQLHVLNVVADLRAEVSSKRSHMTMAVLLIWVPFCWPLLIASFGSLQAAEERAVEIIGNYRKYWRDDLDDLELDLTFLGAPPPSA